MKKNEIFTITTFDGIEMTGIVIDRLVPHAEIMPLERYLCYNHGRLFVCSKYEDDVWDFITILCDNYIPELDELLARYNDIEVATAETADGM